MSIEAGKAAATNAVEERNDWQTVPSAIPSREFMNPPLFSCCCEGVDAAGNTVYIVAGMTHIPFYTLDEARAAAAKARAAAAEEGIALQ